VSTLFAQANFSQPASYALGFVVTGAFYVLVGAILVMLMKNRLAKTELMPQRPVAELRKDKQWLKNELKDWLVLKTTLLKSLPKRNFSVAWAKHAIQFRIQ
jgi:hypothetical protein